MPTWHQYALVGALVLGSVGVVGKVRQLAGIGTPTTHTTTITQAAPADVSPHSSFTGDSTSPQSGTSGTGAFDTITTTQTTAEQPWYLSPGFLNLGASVIGGFIVGWLLRVFVKTTILVGSLMAMLFGALSYFHIMNVDFTSVQQHYNTEVAWLTDQAYRLKDMVIAHLPAHAGGLFGIFMGFRRPKG